MVFELSRRGELAYRSLITALVLRSPYESILSDDFLYRITILLTDNSWCRQIATFVRAAQSLLFMALQCLTQLGQSQLGTYGIRDQRLQALWYMYFVSSHHGSNKPSQQSYNA